ncbi:MAG: lysozyme inhibitor LprI family protein [Clostridium sp.]
MRNKLKKGLLIVLALSLTLMGCGNSVVKKSIEQAKSSIENKEYEKALLSLEMALDEESNNKEAKKLYDMVEGYQNAKKAVEDNKFDEAKKILDNLDSEYTSYAIKADIDLLKSQLDTYGNEAEKVNEILNEAEALYNEKKYTESKMLLYKNILGTQVDEIIEPNKYATEEQRAKAADLANKNDQALIEIDKQKEEQKNQQSKGTKDQYLKKLAMVETGLSDLDYLYESGVTADMVEAEGTVLKRWDDMLNEIYKLLKVQLSKDEMDELTRKQREWIKYRDKTAENEANATGGGSFAGVQYNTTLARITKERCYELVNNYMK